MKAKLKDIKKFLKCPELLKMEIICKEERDVIIENLNGIGNDEISLYQFIDCIDEIESTLDLVYFLSKFLETGKIEV